MPWGRINIKKELTFAKQAYLKGEASKALAICRKVLKNKPGNLTTLQFLGFLSSYTKPKNAVAFIEKSLSIDPYDPYSLLIQGKINMDLKNYALAIEVFKKASLQDDVLFESLHLMGICNLKLGNSSKAVNNFKKLFVSPSWKEKGMEGVALTYYNDFSFEKSFEQFDILSQAFSENSKYHYYKGVCLSYLDKYRLSELCLKKAISLNDNDAMYHQSLGRALFLQGKLRESFHCYKEALKIAPNDLAIRSSFLFILNFIPDIPSQTLLNYHFNWGKILSKNENSKYLHSNTPNPKKTIKVGYVSGDFRRHSVAYFFLPIVMHHNRDKVHVTCYSSNILDDAITEQIKSYVECWRDVRNLTKEETARKINEDEIDILIDLSGHSSHSCLEAFSFRPSPIQGSYLGYPNTTGLGDIDFRLTDFLADPETSQMDYTEDLIYLPKGFLCFLPPNLSISVEEAPCLSQGKVTFGSFNALPKINPNVISLWIEILQKVENSQLLLKNKSFSDSSVRHYFLELFTKNGIDESRLIFLPPNKDDKEHLMTYHRVDISLDTFPYNGTTTTCESMWMGVPCVTLVGDQHRGRVGKSLLHQVECQELIANTSQEYIDICVELGENHKRTASLRKGLREKLLTSPLCNTRYFSEIFDYLYGKMWQDYCDGKS
jgi:protein O-GlcNAc transferase